MISLRIILGLFHLTCVIRTGSSCGGNAELKVVEMCKGGSTTDRHFYLHGSPAGGVQRCACNLTITGAATSVSFTKVTNSDTTCGGIMTLPGGSMRDCGWTHESNMLMYPNTSVPVSFAYTASDVRFCMEVTFVATAANILINCPNSKSTLSSPSTTTAPQTASEFFLSSSTVNANSSSISTTAASPATTLPLFTDNNSSSSTSAPSSTKPLALSTSATLTTSTTKSVSSSETRSTPSVTNIQSGTDDGKPEGTTVEHTSFPVAAVAGGVGAGFLLLIVVVIVVILCYRRGRHVDKQEDDKQEESKGPTEVITNSLYESSADINNTQPTKPLATVERQVNNPTVEGKLHPGLTSDITSATVDQHNGKPTVADQHCGTTGSTAPQDETPDEHRDGPSDMYSVVIKPKKSLEATNIAKKSVHTDPENVSKDKSPPPIDPAAIYAKVNKPSPKTKL